MHLDTNKLKRELAVRYMNATSLAKVTGISRQSIYRILRGANQPKPENLRLICEAIECDPRDLIVED